MGRNLLISVNNLLTTNSVLTRGSPYYPVLTRDMAEGVGFDPTIRFRIHTFQACSFNHSDTPPDTLHPLEATQTSLTSAHKSAATVAPFRAWRGSQLIVARELEWVTINPTINTKHCERVILTFLSLKG